MPLTRTFTCAVLTASTFCSPAAVAQEAEGPAIDISTLALTRELPAWGQLGGVAVDLLGFVYVADFRDDVFKVSPGGEVTVLASGFYGASGNALDARGRLLQASFHGDAVYRVARDGSVETLVGEGLDGPVGLAVDGEGAVWVANCKGDWIGRIDPETGEVAEVARSELFRCPNGLTFDGEGRLYAVSFHTDHLVRVAPDGTVELVATIEPPGGWSEQARRQKVEGNAHLAFLQGALWVTKIKYGSLWRVDLDGSFELVAGNFPPAIADGSAAEAKLSHPNGIAADATAGVLWFNDLEGPWPGRQKGRILLRRVSFGS